MLREENQFWNCGTSVVALRAISAPIRVSICSDETRAAKSRFLGVGGRAQLNRSPNVTGISVVGIRLLHA
jgi:hypothetical protein